MMITRPLPRAAQLCATASRRSSRALRLTPPASSRLLARACSSSSSSGASGASDAAARPLNGLAHSDDGRSAHVAAVASAVADRADAHAHAAVDVDADVEPRDFEFTASRLGLPAFDEAEDEDTEDIREESREAATAKAERILAILRHTMTELDIGRVIHRISQYATTPRVTMQTRKQFLKSLEARFGPEHTREHELVVAFLTGKDHVIDELRDESRRTMTELAAASAAATPEPARDVVVPEIMGLHPELVADPKFIGVAFCYCRMACLNSQKLVRPPLGQHRHAKSSLLQVKHDFRRVLDSEGLSHFAEMMGIKADVGAADRTGGHDDNDDDGNDGNDGNAALLLDGDAEWDEFNLENDRIDFRMLVAETQELIALLKRELSDETIAKMLIAMLASLKTTKLHRKIFQEMVCNIQAALPERSHEAVLSQLVPFLSGHQATYRDFESEGASAALQHHRSRHEAIIRALLETRMRLGHIMIHDLDQLDPLASLSPKLAPDVREKVLTAAYNIVSVLSDREYHVFFSRFLKHKLAWRPSRATFGQTFLEDVRKTLGPRNAAAIMPLFEEIFPHLSVETLTICRVKLRHSKKLLRERAALQAVDERGRERLETTWRADRSVFYRNLPHGVTEKHLRAALDHIGRVKRFVFFAHPVNGAPDQDKWGRHHDDDEDADADADAEQPPAGDDDGVEEEEPAAAAAASPGKRAVAKELKTPRRKTHVIASDKKTSYNVLVEFETEHGRDRALQRALQIFGVMMGGWKEYRPVFSSPAEGRTAISLQNIPFGTSLDSLLTEVEAVLAPHGLALDLSAGQIPRGVLVTSGRVELRFASFVEAAHVVDLLHAHVSRMKSRREPAGDDLFLATARENRRKRLEKEQRAEERRAKRDADAVARKQKKAALKKKTVTAGAMDGSVGEDDDALTKREAAVLSSLSYADVDDDDELVDEEEEEEQEAEDDDVDENEDAYFAAEEELERQLSDEDRALRNVLRPFEVTWNPMPRPKNKHIYV
ncbi:hypothetical protein P43SY_003392 [Pythium insidiosum]|uniref:Uncharacterized protein n=1 Tax=Pythium insidiosum TaxID=114742 RepID=A0AAD5Q8Z6_PYTIN|nr:hypothetical protein P43SY_003392 [Pythium insidiosum]